MTTRRDVLGVGASIALGISSLPAATGALAQAAGHEGGPNTTDWDQGDVVHMLPTSSPDRILLKVSFRQPLDAAPVLHAGDQRLRGVRSDTRGSYWQFHAGDLKAGTPHQLALTASDGRRLCQPWTLSTMPALDDTPAKLRLLVYSCAGGHDIFSKGPDGIWVPACRGSPEVAAARPVLRTGCARRKRRPCVLGSSGPAGSAAIGCLQGGA